MIVIEILGTPAPKGNARAFVNKRTGKAILASFGTGTTKARLESWDHAVRNQACVSIFDGAMPTRPTFVDVPLSVTIVFHLARPSGHWSPKGLKPSAPARPAKKPDIDKLIRATLDPLHGILFDDDSRIVEIAASKLYAAPGQEGCRITVEVWRAA